MATLTLQQLDTKDDEIERSEPKERVIASAQKCVLLIEDSEEAMLLVRFALDEWGGGLFRLEWANNLGAGLDRLSAAGIDLVLLDLGLPDSSGPESYAWVRELAPTVPVVVLTGDSRRETEFAVTTKGADGFLVKSQISSWYLLEVIRAALAGDEGPARPKICS
jgi:DNA-binding response OmpR family regulator